ncbi:unnamed protein product [Brachionus calyciflorus]|uniref:Uncharacterized protein n=1 Tax=Brachionus calyciflorus TaxID=104777 RepID=A0A814M5A9_9BILA|nr:unnamed protein product [Brachionus calyciflorus]
MCCLSTIFYFIAKLNEVPNKFRLDTQASVFFNKIYDKIGELIHQANPVDGFVCALLGKTCSQVLKLTMVLHMFAYSFKLVDNQKELNRENLSEQHKIFILNHEKTDEFKIIKKETLDYSFKMSCYFNLSKLIMANYSCKNWNSNFFEIIADILNSNINHLSQNECKIIKKILTYPMSEFENHKINILAKNVKAIDIKNAFRTLEKLRLGKCSTKISGNNKEVTLFKKLTLDEISSEIHFSDYLEKFDINFDDYFQETNNKSLNKRPLELSENRSNKRTKSLHNNL